MEVSHVWCSTYTQPQSPAAALNRRPTTVALFAVWFRPIRQAITASAREFQSLEFRARSVKELEPG